nr:MAG TPA: hypothetical protein [Caudoviricetes sp.]
MKFLPLHLGGVFYVVHKKKITPQMGVTSFIYIFA